MMNTETLLIIMTVLFTATILLILILLLNNIKKTNELNSELTRSILETRSALSKDFLDFHFDLNNEFNNFSERVNSNIIQSNRSSSEIYRQISERMARIDETQKNLNDLSDDISALKGILRDKKSRGIFGEIELYSLLENIYGQNQTLYQKQYKLPGGTIADAVLFNGNDLKMICIDSKFPLENYLRMHDDALDETAREKAARQFKEDVRKHLKDISQKYILPGITADMAFLFLPAEAIFAEIYASHPDLVSLSYRLKTYIVSPTTLMAYLTAIRSVHLDHLDEKKAREMKEMLLKLSADFDRYEQRMADLYRDYEKIGKDFIDLKISSDKITKRFHKIRQGEISDDGE